MRVASLLTLAILLLAMPAQAREVLLVQSVRGAMYDEAVKGFLACCPSDARKLLLSDYADPQLARVLREERPRLVVAVGDGALEALRSVRNTPMLALMSLGVPKRETTGGNVARVDLFVKPEQYLPLFKMLGAKRVGVVYDPARTGWYVRHARNVAKQQGVELVLREVSDSRQALGQLSSLKGAVDALWVLPDLTAVTKETLEGYFLFGQSHSIPVISFSAAHLRLGALIAVDVDRVELGRQAGELAQQLLHGAQPADVPVTFPRKVSIRVNDAVARRLRYSSELITGLRK